MPSRCPPCRIFATNVNETFHYESNHCFPRWMCSSCDGWWYSFLRARQQNAADDNPRPNILQLNTEGLSANKISVLEQMPAYKGFHHSPEGDPQHICRQASDSQLFASCVSPERESWPCHICPRAVAMFTDRSVSRAIRDWMFVRRRCET